MATTYSVTAWRNPRNATYSKYGEYCAEWANTSNILSENGVGAVLPSGEGINSSRKTAYLVGYNYGFAVPSNASIVGVEVRIVKRKSTNGGTAKDYLIALRNGTTANRGYIGRNFASGSLWGKSYFSTVYGNSRDKLGANLTPAVVNSSTFGVVFRAIGTVSTYSNIAVDAIQVRVHYAITTDTTAPPVITEPTDPDTPPVVDVPTEAPTYGRNLVPYELGHPTILMSDHFVTKNADYSTMDMSKVTLENGYYKVTTIGGGSYSRMYLCVPKGCYAQPLANLYYRPYQLLCSPNTQYNVQATFKNPVGGIVQYIVVDWYTSAGNFISQSAVSGTPTANTDTLIQGNVTSPSNAGMYALSFQYTSGTAGTFYVKNIQVSAGNYVLYRPSRYHITNWQSPQTADTVNPHAYNASATWNNPNNIRDYETSNYARCGLNKSSYDTSWNLRGYNFGFNVPSDGVITGICTTIMKNKDSTNAQVYDNYFAINGLTVTTNKPQTDTWTVDNKTWFYGNGYDCTYLWGNTSVTPAQVNSSSFGFTLVAQLNLDIWAFNVFGSAIRIVYKQPMPKKTVLPSTRNVELNPDSQQLQTAISQAPTTYFNDVKLMEFQKQLNLVRRQLGYIGMITLDRGHHYGKITRKNTLLKEYASGATNYSKKGEIEEGRPLVVRIPKNKVKMLEGLVDIQGIVPIDTVIGMSDNDPYAHKGYGIISEVQHERVNDGRSECDIEVDYVSKDLRTPLTVDYLQKTLPPVDDDILDEAYNALLYLTDGTMDTIENYMTYSPINTPTVTKTSTSITSVLDPNDTLRYQSNISINRRLKASVKFTYDRVASSGVNVVLVNSMTSKEVISIGASATNVSFVTITEGTGNSPITQVYTIADGTNMTIDIEVDENNKCNASLIVDNGSGTVNTYSVSDIDLGIGTSYQLKVRHAFTGTGTSTAVIKEIAYGEKLFSSDIDSTIRNIIHTPEPLNVNIPYDFLRKSTEGNLYSYVNPSREILFTIDPSRFFDTSVKLIDESGARIITTDMVISSIGTLTLDNGVIKAIFDVPNNKIYLYGFLYAWIYLGTLTLTNMFHVKPIQVGFDMVQLQVGETKWVLRRGKPYFEVYHPYDDLIIEDSFNKMWYDKGDGMCITKDIGSVEEPLNMNTLFYGSIWNSSNSIRMQIIRPDYTNLTTKKITKCAETGIGWFNPLATDDTHYKLALEYLAKSNQDIFVYLG